MSKLLSFLQKIPKVLDQSKKSKPENDSVPVFSAQESIF